MTPYQGGEINQQGSIMAVEKGLQGSNAFGWNFADTRSSLRSVAALAVSVLTGAIAAGHIKLPQDDGSVTGALIAGGVQLLIVVGTRWVTDQSSKVYKDLPAK